MINKLYKSESLLGVMFSIFLLTLIIYFYFSWIKDKNAQEIKMFHQWHMLQIIDNQITLKTLGYPCEKIIRENNINFKISCNKMSIKVESELTQMELSQE